MNHDVACRSLSGWHAFEILEGLPTCMFFDQRNQLIAFSAFFIHVLCHKLRVLNSLSNVIMVDKSHSHSVNIEDIALKVQ